MLHHELQPRQPVWEYFGAELGCQCCGMPRSGNGIIASGWLVLHLLRSSFWILDLSRLDCQALAEGCDGWWMHVQGGVYLVTCLLEGLSDHTRWLLQQLHGSCLCPYACGGVLLGTPCLEPTLLPRVSNGCMT